MHLVYYSTQVTARLALFINLFNWFQLSVCLDLCIWTPSHNPHQMSMFLPFLPDTLHSDFKLYPRIPVLHLCYYSKKNPYNIPANVAIHYVCDKVAYYRTLLIVHCNVGQREEHNDK